MWRSMRLRAVLLPLLLVQGLSSCQQDTPSKGEVRQQGASSTEAPSPNASILPAPLSEGAVQDVPVGGSGAVDASAERDRESPAPPRKPAVPLPATGPLRNRPVLSGQGSGVVLEASFHWPELHHSLELNGQEIPLWPKMHIELLAGAAGAPGRARLRFDSPVFSVPMGSELRGHEDAQGFIIVWPDSRSYRVVSHGAIAALLQERRVDRMPSVPVELRRLGTVEVLGRQGESYEVKGPVGTLELDLVPVVEAGGAGKLLCRFLLSLVRAAPRLSACRSGVVPLRARFRWPGGGRLEFSTSELSLQSELSQQEFSMPPALSIYKPGELPPADYSVWSPSQLRQVFPPGEELSEVLVSNHEQLALLLFVEGRPLSWLQPMTSASWHPPAGELRVRARDFFGKNVLDATARQERSEGGAKQLVIHLGTPPPLPPPAPPLATAEPPSK